MAWLRGNLEAAGSGAMDTTQIAIESYAEEQRAIGDAFLAKGLAHIRVVDRRLSDLVNNFVNEVAVRRRDALADASRAGDASLAVTLIAILLGAAASTILRRWGFTPSERYAITSS